MPVSRASFLRSSLLLLLVGLASLVLVIGTSVWLVQRTQGYVEEVVQMRQIRSSVADLLSLMQDAETSQRGYLLTAEESYLGPFNSARDRLPARLDALSVMAQKSADVRAFSDQLKDVLIGKMRELGETIELARQGRRDEAIEVVRTDRGKDLMDNARTIFARLVANADARLNALVADQNASANALWWVTILGGLIILAVTGAGMIVIMRYTREIADARREVEALNTGLEERVSERTAELGRANEEIQRFAYIVTHDLRAPLVNMMGFTAELETSLAQLQTFVSGIEGQDGDPAFRDAKLAATEDLPEALGFIRTSTRKMDGLINAILKLSREGRRVLRPETVDLAALVQAAAAAVNHQVAEADGEVTIDMKKASAIVSDRMSLEQVIGNLLDNAVKYRRRDVPLRITVRGQRDDFGRIRLEVEDNGRGIAETDRERVFELFRRSGQQDQQGEGIGLAHVRTLVRNLGGEITLTSTFGQGTTFSILLPQDLRILMGRTAA